MNAINICFVHIIIGILFKELVKIGYEGKIA